MIRRLYIALAAMLVAVLIATPLIAQSIGVVPSQGGNPGFSWATSGGHMWFGGAPPTVNSSCGTGASVVGTDAAFTLTLGTSSSSACRVTFVNRWNKRPACSNDGSSVLSTVAVDPGGITLSGGTVDGAAYDFVCFGQPGG